MTTIHRAQPQQLSVHDRAAPKAVAVTPSVLVAVRWRGGRLLLVRRRDSGMWELPGGCVDVGESAVAAAVRHTSAATGVHILVTGIAALFTDPSYVLRSTEGEVRQEFALLFRARSLGGEPRGDPRETIEAAWVAVVDVPALPMEPSARSRVVRALEVGEPPYLG
jgi:8-oxo-dGTP diphosphatase